MHGHLQVCRLAREMANLPPVERKRRKRQRHQRSSTAGADDLPSSDDGDAAPVSPFADPHDVERVADDGPSVLDGDTGFDFGPGPSDPDLSSSRFSSSDESEPEELSLDAVADLQLEMLQENDMTQANEVHDDFVDFCGDSHVLDAEIAAARLQKSASHGNTRWARYLDSWRAKKALELLVRIPRGIANQLLELMHASAPDHYPPSMYVLRQCAKSWYRHDTSGMSEVPQEELPASLRGHVQIFYHSMERIVSQVRDVYMRNPDAFSLFHEARQPDEPLKRCAQSERFRQCQEDILRIIDKSGSFPLLFSLFVDDYVRTLFRMGADTAIILSAANNNLFDAILGGVITSDISIKGDDYRLLMNALVEHIVKPGMVALKKGFPELAFPVRNGQPRVPRGVLYALTCDDVAARELMGLVAPNSNHPSRFTENERSTFGDASEHRILRSDPHACPNRTRPCRPGTCDIWRHPHGTATDHKNALSALGLHTIRPALLDVPGMQKGEGFFENQNIDDLHQSLLGEWKRNILAMLVSAHAIDSVGS
jgi:hypothetical protein